MGTTSVTTPQEVICTRPVAEEARFSGEDRWLTSAYEVRMMLPKLHNGRVLTSWVQSAVSSIELPGTRRLHCILETIGKPGITAWV